jgi:5-formyltetrahydrofolate cyclo-ligase
MYIDNNMSDSKQELRARFSGLRKSIPAAAAEKLSARIAQNIFSLPRLLGSDMVMVYCRTGAEVDTASLIDIIASSGRAVAFPHCRGDGSMGVGRVFSPRDDLAPGPLGTFEPVDRLKDNVSALQLGAVVCPGVAFDAQGGRLGRGGGHYDRFLRWIRGKVLIIGCAYDCQISETPLPGEEHDVPMDVVITEKRAFPEGSCPALMPQPENVAGSNYTGGKKSGGAA